MRPMARKQCCLLLAMVAVLFISCQAVPRGSSGALFFEPAIITKEDVEEAVTIEADLATRYRTPPPEGHPWFATLPGTARVLVVAGHATAHMREGQRKPEDAGTGSLAVMLNRLARSPAIYTIYQSPSDPNYYDDNDFKRALSQMLKQYEPAIVLDLHASHFNRPYDVDFGTMGGTSLLGTPGVLHLLAKSLKREGLLNFSQDFFPAAKQQTVTKWVSRQSIPAIQSEFNATWLLSPGGRGENILQWQRFAQLLQALVRFIHAVTSQRLGVSPFVTPNEEVAARISTAVQMDSFE